MPENRTVAHYGLLAELFDFPGPSTAARGREVLALLRDNYPAAASELQCFLDGIPPLPLDLQELHTRTFDVQSITTLDIGYVLFGDDYKRAELLSNLTREHTQVENDCQRELADHLPNVLRLLPRLKDRDLRAELVSEILVPALLLMIREFDTSRIEKKNTNYQKHYKTLIDPAPGSDLTIYCRALKALLEVLMKDFQVTSVVAKLSDWSARLHSTHAENLLRRPAASDPCRRQPADFLGLIEKEMEIENNANPTNSGCDV